MIELEWDDVLRVVRAAVVVATAGYGTATVVRNRRRPAPPLAEGDRALANVPPLAVVVPLEAVLVAFAAALSWAVATGRTQGVDQSLSRRFVALDGLPAADPVARALLWGGQVWFVGPLLFVVAGWRARRSGRNLPLWVSLAAFGGLSAGVWLLKDATGRAAPRAGFGGVDRAVSYPSGHSALAALTLPLILVLLAQTVRPRRARAGLLTGCALAVATGVCTIVMGWHWPTDVIAGWVVGAVFALPAVRLLWRPSARAASAEPVLGHGSRADLPVGRHSRGDKAVDP